MRTASFQPNHNCRLGPSSDILHQGRATNETLAHKQAKSKNVCIWIASGGGSPITSLGNLRSLKSLMAFGCFKIADKALSDLRTASPPFTICSGCKRLGDRRNRRAEHNIFTAAALGDADMVRDLLSTDPTLASKTTDYDLLGMKDLTALHYACWSELGKVNQACAGRLVLYAESLLDQQSTLAAALDRSVSPLGLCAVLCASRGGNVKIAQLLMAHGWRPSISTVLGALGHSFRHGKGNYDVAALCLEAGVDINEFIGTRSLLHAFAHQGDIVGTRWLVEHGAKINAKDCGNDTPLHKACERNSTLKVVELLVERGASLTAKNKNGETPLDMAIRNDKTSIAAYLRGVGAKPALVDKRTGK